MSHKAYMWIEAILTDPQQFAEYGKRMVELVPQYGGRYVVFRGECEALEGEFGDTRVVVSEWASMQAARAFWHSDAYAEVRKLRGGTGTFRVLLLESLNSSPAVGGAP